MKIRKISAFSDGATGGNPAGVVLCEQLPSTESMQATAAAVGYSETVFASPLKDSSEWRVRYFSPESEVPFCGHATIALGAALAEQHGNATYQLKLNHGQVAVSGEVDADRFKASLISPPTHSQTIDAAEIQASLALFGYQQDQLDTRIAPARINAGANHYLFALKTQADLSAMQYSLSEGRAFMRDRDLTTIMLVQIQSPQLFLARNAFASGGVLEDPATGAAAAAFMGYLRDIAWPSGGQIQINQGDDMGAPSRITAEHLKHSNLSDPNINRSPTLEKNTSNVGESIKLSGFAHYIV
ncbi:PhzF family phenazine biosynthesis protein [Arenicella xantha]|uniref:PhzF family phenazine biosynthesis protein n=1 Tax=Arenicella xantha TaxID=644221 RepID=A0A395JT23_9GAMM|nr:PhzF family phenazine biosynthesis protein [Arenicella xantha]RBP52708.1 PhzF family phenazine biosynthesis protein [Arenicella xantha]